jgi:hypothetical protein
MRILRGLAGAVLWILSALLGLLGVILCVTIILLPVGIPLLGYARRAFTFSLKLMLPRAVTHPVDTAEKTMHRRGRKVREDVAARKAKRARKKLPFFS